MVEPFSKIMQIDSIDVLFWFYFMIYSSGENLQTYLLQFRDIHFLMKVFIVISDGNAK